MLKPVAVKGGQLTKLKLVKLTLNDALVTKLKLVKRVLVTKMKLMKGALVTKLKGARSWGVGIAQWLEHWTHDQKILSLSLGRSGGRTFFSRVNLLCWLLFWYPFHPHVTAVVCKRSPLFCQKAQMAGYSSTHIHPTYVALTGVTL